MKIKNLTNLTGKLITIEGKKTIDDKGEIEVSVNTARQMVDGKNWELAKGEKFPPLKKKVEEQYDEEDLEDENEEEIEDNDDEGDGDNDDVGDNETAELLKSIPKMKYKEAISTAEELGIDVEQYPKKDLLKLKTKIIKVLKGKETAEE